jgi:hypothetical protein
MTDETPNRAAIETRVTVELVSASGAVEQLSLVIVPDKKADYYAGFLGESTVLAKAILGHAVGEEIPYPVGNYQKVRIVLITGINEGELAGAAEKRQAEVREAIRQSERTSAMIFSTTVEGKWGEYETDGLENWE